MTTPLLHSPYSRAAAIGALGLLVYAGWSWSATTATESTDDATIVADHTVVAPQVSGFINAVLVEDNQTVKKGQPLARIDDREYQAALAAATAELAVTAAQLSNADATLERQQAVINQALAVTRADLADIRFATSEVQRHRRLAGEGAGTQQVYEQAKSRLEMAEARQAEHQATLQAAHKQQEVLVAQRDAAQAGLHRAQALKERAELNLSYTQITSPIDGVIGRRALRVGAYVSPGTPILAVVPLQQAYVVANFRERQLTHMRPGQRVTLTVDAYPDIRLLGHVQSIAPATGLSFSPVAPSNATGNFTKVAQRLPVKIILDTQAQDAPALRAGMSVEAVVDTSTAVAGGKQ
ncbi:HlyD family secretion protein [Achromobacter seleniivolatilans]|uniref:HlyD family secretion protein n=1 Tax=Achromobacter seleniivolatilans TaxID=3047478 RepID=A0ABY9M032_9BURK|nr:HlyD family secretion protein [Achromobacter sp. R39]WMD20347.1 HlyD family secretion protein [Achromobacter sp. R39]